MTRNKDNLHAAGCQTSHGLKSIKYKDNDLWNQLPADLKLITSTNSFKSKLKLILQLPIINYQSSLRFCIMHFLIFTLIALFCLSFCLLLLFHC